MKRVLKNADINILSTFWAIFFQFFLIIENFCQMLSTCQGSDRLDHSSRNYGGEAESVPGHTNLQKARPV